MQKLGQSEFWSVSETADHEPQVGVRDRCREINGRSWTSCWECLNESVGNEFVLERAIIKEMVRQNWQQVSQRGYAPLWEGRRIRLRIGPEGLRIFQLNLVRRCPKTITVAFCSAKVAPNASFRIGKSGNARSDAHAVKRIASLLV